ncbi:hypothetical protein [Pantoea eucrina]|uniref:hypothetical protein n=1 Tax=Pantoea eucrina TaxID=472693 RepID=UPI00301B741C
MNVIIPPKRRDKKTSFRKLVEYVSTREENKNAEQVQPEPAHTPNAGSTATPGFGQLVDYVAVRTYRLLLKLSAFHLRAFSACFQVKCCAKPTAFRLKPQRQK